MFVVVGWFASHPLAEPEADQLRRRVEQSMNAVVPDSYLRHRLGGEDWGVEVAYVRNWSHWRWPVLEQSGALTAVSMGVPLGVEAEPQRMAARLLDGQDVHAEVVPPFTLLAGDGDRWVLQQDWLGMARIFTGTAEGVDVVATRPGLVAQALGQPLSPDREGWASYVACGHFAAESSPYAGVRQLAPGQRMTWRRTQAGWQGSSRIQRATDDVVADGLAARRDCRPDRLLDWAAESMTSATSGLYRLFDEPIVLGLSGGKDSRLIAASVLAAGDVPRFHTIIDTPAEGEIAVRLVELLRAGGTQVEHTLERTRAVETVGAVGLQERVRRLQRSFDYQFPSTFTTRRPVSGRLTETASASLSGAGGELVTAYWHPKLPDEDTSRAATREALRHKLFAACPRYAVADEVRAAQEDRLDTLLDRGESLGLQGAELGDYVYLVERVRRWYTSAYRVGTVTPYLAPGFVAASFALSPAQKRARIVHEGLICRLAPQWADVPYVGVTTGVSTAASIWDGDGLPALHELLDTAGGDLTGLMRRTAVAQTIAACADGAGNKGRQRVLEQYACLAIASIDLQPEATRTPTQSYPEFLAAQRRKRPPSQRIPAPLRPLAQRLRRTKVGGVLRTWLPR